MLCKSITRTSTSEVTSPWRSLVQGTRVLPDMAVYTAWPIQPRVQSRTFSWLVPVLPVLSISRYRYPESSTEVLQMQYPDMVLSQGGIESVESRYATIALAGLGNLGGLSNHKCLPSISFWESFLNMIAQRGRRRF